MPYHVARSASSWMQQGCSTEPAAWTRTCAPSVRPQHGQPRSFVCALPDGTGERLLSCFDIPTAWLPEMRRIVTLCACYSRLVATRHGSSTRRSVSAWLIGNAPSCFDWPSASRRPRRPQGPGAPGSTFVSRRASSAPCYTCSCVLLGQRPVIQSRAMVPRLAFCSR